MTQKKGAATPAGGVHPRWASGWKREREALQAYRDNPELALLDLRHYADTGATLEQPSWREPDERGWEGYLPSQLARYAAQREAQLELAGMDSKVFDADAAGAAFAAAYTWWLADAWQLGKQIERGRDPLPDVLYALGLPFTALGVVIGARGEAEALARAQLFACGKGYYQVLYPYPLIHLMLRMLADHLGEPLKVPATWAKEPACEALLEAWLDPDPGRLVPACMGVCDLHTHRSIPKASEMREYDNGQWTRNPIEMLLLFKLRQLRGLANPEIEHPLMNSGLGKLPPDIGFKPDELLTRVRSRMVADGFDEARILAIYGVRR